MIAVSRDPATSKVKGILDEALICSYSFSGEPQQKVFGAVGSTQSNHFIFPHTKILHEPISDSLQCIIELLISPRSTLILQERMVWPIQLGPILYIVVQGQLAFRFLFSNIFLSFDSSIVESSLAEICSNMILCIEICRCGCRPGDGCCYCGC